MVQETQTQGNWYQTPNLIPGVGISERKIKGHTQITPTKTYTCRGDSDEVYIAVGGSTPDASDYGSIHIGDITGGVDFCEVDGGLRVPLAGIYEITWEAVGGYTGIAARHDLMVGNTSLDHFSTNPSSKSNTIIVNLGRYDIIRYKLSASYGGSDIYNVHGHIIAIKIQKL